MTIVCVTNDDLPGIRPCTELGEHRVTCPDPDTCRGCLPLAAAVGFLCHHCYSLVEQAYAGWDRWSTLIVEAGGRAVTATSGGGGSAALGYSNLSLAFLELDACNRHLATRGDLTLLMWVNEPAGAAHAIQFAHTALNAYRTLEVEERARKTPPPARCPHCGLLTATRNTESVVGAYTVIDCQHCGERLDKVRTGPDSWSGSHACESVNGADHADCTDVDCACWCHHYGAKSRRAGIELLWEADHHTAAPGAAPRHAWTITDPHTITRRDADTERKTA